MIALDIETIPNLNLLDSLPEPEVALGNLKDPDKISAKVIEARTKQREHMALSPFYGRICSFATYGRNTADRGFEVIGDISDAAEIALVEKLLNLFCATATTTPAILTWNGHAFDIPFIYKRAMLLRVKCPEGLFGLSRMCKKYCRSPHLDLMQEMCGWGQERIKLDTAARMILGDCKTEGIEYDKFIAKIESGLGAEIGVYNYHDVELTYGIYERVEQYLF